MTNEQKIKYFIGVITLAFLISVLSISFSFFYMQAKGTNGVKTESARLGLTLDVKRLTNSQTIGLYPILDNQLQQAINGTQYGSCVDNANKGRCQVYEVKLTNTGNITATIMGTLELKPSGENSKFTNLKWMEIRGEKDATSFGNIHNYTDKNWKNNYVMGARASSTFYLMIWISEINNNQNNQDKGAFTGSITFNTTAGAGTSASFTG